MISSFLSNIDERSQIVEPTMAGPSLCLCLYISLSAKLPIVSIFLKYILRYHRTTGRFGLEGTFRRHPAQPPCSKQGHLQLDQGAQSPVKPGLGCLQGWGISHLSGQLLPGFHQPHCIKISSLYPV